MKRIFLTFILSVSLIFILAISSFAYEIPNEYEGTQYGAGYDTTHDEDNCCSYPSGSSVEHGNHYESGYSDGFKDGYQSGLENEEELSEAQKQAFLEQYFQSQEFKDRIAQAKADGVSEFKNSIEYANVLDEARREGAENFKSSDEYKDEKAEERASGERDGYNAGYNEAAEAMYSKGLADGSGVFKKSEEYKQTLQSTYELGFEDGYVDGYNSDEDSNPVAIVGLVATLFVLFGIYIFITMISKKSKGKK